MRRTLRPILLAAPLALACAGSTSPAAGAPAQTPSGIWAGVVTASAGPAGIVARNQTERPVFYTAFERGTLAYVKWAPCVTGPSCRVMLQGATATLPWSEVSGYASGKQEYVFYWWQAITDPDGETRPGAVQSVIVTR